MFLSIKIKQFVPGNSFRILFPKFVLENCFRKLFQSFVSEICFRKFYEGFRFRNFFQKSVSGICFRNSFQIFFRNLFQKFVSGISFKNVEKHVVSKNLFGPLFLTRRLVLEMYLRHVLICFDLFFFALFCFSLPFKLTMGFLKGQWAF